MTVLGLIFGYFQASTAIEILQILVINEKRIKTANEI